MRHIIYAILCSVAVAGSTSSLAITAPQSTTTATHHISHTPHYTTPPTALPAARDPSTTACFAGECKATVSELFAAKLGSD